MSGRRERDSSVGRAAAKPRACGVRPAGRRTCAVPQRSQGAFLLEALVAIVVFSLALLGVAAAVAASLRHAGDAHWRSEAVDLGAATLARMSLEDPALLVSRYDAGGNGYRALLAQAARLPGVSAFANVPAVTIDDDAERRRILVTLYWQPPGDARIHHAQVAAALPRP